MSSDAEYYIKGVMDGDRRTLARAITLVESSLPRHQETARAVVHELLPHTGRGVRVGITGVPGVGKSTFIETFGMMLTGERHRVAVLAIDPSSTRSGGSVMADKTRMEKLSVDPGAFIRPSPSGGTLGGVARKTREIMLLCEAAGFDIVIVETVGVGQSEISVAGMVDFFLVLMLSGAGDELQGIKKGVVELADAIAVNKADGDNIERAKASGRMYETALHLLQPATPTWNPKVLTCSAKEATGIQEIWNTILEYRRKMSLTGEFEEKRRRQALDWMWALIEEGLRERFRGCPEIREMLPKISRSVEKGDKAPTEAAMSLLRMLDRSG